MTDLRSRKRQLRAEAELLRQSLKAATPDAGAHAADLLLGRVQAESRRADDGIWRPGATISTYHPRGSEMETAALNQALIDAGYDLALPVVLGRGHPLAFRRYRPFDALMKGLLDVMEPLPAAPIITPRILLVPLLAFDRQGNRLGYGGGQYGRTVALFRRESLIQAVGIAFAGQEMAAIPIGVTDAPLDWIVTEQEAFRCRTA